MSSPAPALLALLAQVDENWPKRSKLSDGIMGDAAHAARQSDHNDGNALDITADSEGNGPNLDDLANVMFRDSRVRYVIWNHRIANREVEAGRWRPYLGSNPHTRHLHVSIYAAGREDKSSWPDQKATGWDAQTSGPEAEPPPANVAAAGTGNGPPADAAGIVKAGILAAWTGGSVDNVTWVRADAGSGYELFFPAEPLSVHGLRLPASFDDVIGIASSAALIPNTRAICDARYAAAPRKLDAITTPDPGGERFNDLAQILSFNRRMGPVGTTLVDGAWKEWIVEPGMEPGKAVNYGMRIPEAERVKRKLPAGAVYQNPGHAHPATYKGYSQLYAPPARRAFYQGAEIDLLDHLARGCPLGGPFPAWLVARLRKVKAPAPAPMGVA